MSIKQIKKEQARFNVTYNTILDTPYGSLLQSIGILNPEFRRDKYAFVRRFEKTRLPYMDDPKFVKGVLDAFNITYEDVKDLPIVRVDSKYNFLYFPFIEGSDGDPIVLPLLKDGLYQSTVHNRESLKVVNWEEEFADD